MRIAKIVLPLTALALGTVLAGAPAFAQNAARSANDGGMLNTQNPSPQQGDYYAPDTGMQTSAPAPNGPTPGDYYAPQGLQMNAQGEQSAASYCASRFRSYDPASGTYLGFDGVRHSCP
jgi:hypothetical protein